MKVFPLSLVTLLAGCVAPASPPQTFLGPAFNAKKSSSEVALIGGGDALAAGSARIMRPVSQRLDLDLGLAGGYSFVGADMGVWFRSRTTDNPLGKKVNNRLRFALAMGAGTSLSSEVITEGSATAITEQGLRDNLYGGWSILHQYNLKRGNKKGSMSLNTGLGLTIGSSQESFNFYMDAGLRFDKPSGLFYGVGLQMLPMSASKDWPLPVIPAVAAGSRF